MNRIPNAATDFTVPVEGVGEFTFGKKGIRDQFAIEAEYSRLTEGMDIVTNFLWNIATAFANLKILTVKAPDGWDLETLDPEDGDSYRKLMLVWGALRDKQATFRKKPEPVGESQGEGASRDA